MKRLALAFLALFAAAGIATVITAKRVDRFGLDHIGIAVLAVSYPVIGLLMYFVLADGYRAGVCFSLD